MQIAGKVVVITGAAQGIGRALAERFCVEGAAKLIVADISAQGAADTAGLVGGIGFACDVSQADEVQKMVDRVEAEVGPIDLYCSNAGVLERDLDIGDAASASDEAWTRSWNVNVMGHVHAARALLPYWRKRQAGYFLATVSAAGLLTQVGSAPYSATKHAALAFCESLAITHRDDGVQVSALCPQAVETPMIRGATGREPAFADGLLSPHAVADTVVQGLAEGRFLILPHPKVAAYFKAKAEDYDRWLAAMAKLRRAQMG
jgi:NAD(P)-dependent dehydrogenase (short-subunit alcohol dehydrogenase family)